MDGSTLSTVSVLPAVAEVLRSSASFCILLLTSWNKTDQLGIYAIYNMEYNKEQSLRKQACIP